jgi:site-specific recombinase XerD
MTEERGLAQATVTTVRSELPKFLKYTAGKTLKQMRLADVEIFLAHLGEEGWTRHGINRAHIIRDYFKYGEVQRWTKPGIGAEIHGPHVTGAARLRFFSAYACYRHAAELKILFVI